MRARLVSRLVTFVVAGALVLSLSAPARAQIDPMTLSLIISGAQLLMGVVSTVVVGGSYEAGKRSGPVPLGTPCGVQESGERPEAISFQFLYSKSCPRLNGCSPSASLSGLPSRRQWLL